MLSYHTGLDLLNGLSLRLPDEESMIFPAPTPITGIKIIPKLSQLLLVEYTGNYKFQAFVRPTCW